MNQPTRAATRSPDLPELGVRSADAERLIASGRVLLAVLAWVATLIDPPGSISFGRPLSFVLGVYLLYAVLLATASVWTLRLPRRLVLLSHGLDLGFFGFLSFVYQGSSSPYYALFVFALVSAAIRWSRRGVRWTAALALLAYGAVGWYSWLGSTEPQFELDLFLIRLGVLFVLALMLGSLTGHHERLRADLRRIARWPPGLGTDPSTRLRESLLHCADVLRVERLGLLWQSDREPGQLAILDSGELEQHPLDPSQGSPWVPTEVEERDFVVELREWKTTTLDPGGAVVGHQSGPPFHPEVWALLVRRLPFDRALCWRLRGESHQGLLIACDPRRLRSDLLETGRIAARMLSSTFDQRVLQDGQRRLAGDQERLRLARELHDGLAQSLAASALQLEVVRRLLQGVPRDVDTKLSDVQESLSSDQRELREFIHWARHQHRNEPWSPIAERLDRLARRAERTWSTNVDVAVEGELDSVCSGELVNEIYQLCRESITNAGRHSGAGRVELELARQGSSQLRLVVRDDGHGFSFRGRRDLGSLLADGSGPTSLCQRIEALGGEVTIDSSSRGTEIEILLSTTAKTGD